MCPVIFDPHLLCDLIFYVSGPGRYLKPRQNGKCQFQGYLVSAAAAAAGCWLLAAAAAVVVVAAVLQWELLAVVPIPKVLRS